MKNSFRKFILPLSFGFMLSLLSIVSISTISLSGCDTEHCKDSAYPLYCSSANKCCPSGMPYTDGHGTCYGTLEGCRASGYSCEHCWEE